MYHFFIFRFVQQCLTPWCSDPVARPQHHRSLIRPVLPPCELHQVWACQEPLGVSGVVCQDPLEPPPGASGQVCQEPLERLGSSGAVCQEPPPLGGSSASSSEALPVAPGGASAKGPQPFLAFLRFRLRAAPAERWRRPEALVVGPGAMRKERVMDQCTSWPRLL